MSNVTRGRVFLIRTALTVFCAVLLSDLSTHAGTIYVDNRIGNDGFSGTSRVAAIGKDGPVRTIRRALQLIRAGDTVILANHGDPYYESMELVGRRCCGHDESVPLRILGNGAVLSGARGIPASAWRQTQSRLWRFTPWRKGYYLLLKDGHPLPEQPCQPEADALPGIPEGHWCAWKGSIYYNPGSLATPADQKLQFAAKSVGLTLYDVHGIRIADLTFRHFRLDGINAHDRCRDVVLENVTACENGRAGLCVAGSSDVVVRDSKLTDNRCHSVLITEQAGAALERTELSQPATVRP